MRKLPLFVVDAFTRTQFRGNPAAVCFPEDELPDDVMQSIAAEMNHSETAFVRSHDGPAEQAARFTLRWFSPRAEIPLCGHATLAAAAVIFRELANPAARLEFDTRSGLPAAARRDPAIVLDFPAEDFRPAPADAAVVAALGSPRIEAACSARNGRNLLLHLSNCPGPWSQDKFLGECEPASETRRAPYRTFFAVILSSAAGSSWST
jgi:predicted PhzF superfamily epimerase YddE/YHI9